MNNLFKNYVNEKGWELYDIYTDEESGSDSNRAGIQRLIKDAQEKIFDVIVAKEFSRISRNSAFLYGFKDAMIANRIHFITLDDTKKNIN
ncbi:hypothetical protein DCE79_16750 [Lysinibacillus sp. 2017]|uniref:recombinase family protein n=1 Tax=Lysinibacillus sp. S2017 TaxID=2561923 RepID=UPI000D5268F9|nr:hypothetical protein DCE79_16750 [Lysinibacillus sp. 2017]TGN34756.1 recombinase family protein [Lysinibacillus sp. S2017]